MYSFFFLCKKLRSYFLYIFQLFTLLIFLSPTVHAGKNENNHRHQAEAKPHLVKATQVLMLQKLQHAQGLLADLAREDFKSVAENAEALETIAIASSWYSPDSPDYQRYFQNFRESVKFTAENAKKKNLEGVAMGYIRITLTCMQCHNFVREGREQK